ncbi:MAG: molybdate ABC transporter substrate-binding protein [Xanthomonadales bacterium]|nr:molybdate ABC transporter substrate-binding protein [Xanthomonadales bacterium]
MKIILALLAVLPLQAGGERIQVAVASNFRNTAETLARHFGAQSGKTLVVSYGSTGKHYAQIVNGAPFHAFLAADEARPARLEAQGKAIRGTRFTYAIGRLALWSPRTGYVDSDGRVLRSRDFRHLAIANPDLAPYGRAARETLRGLGLWETLSERLVRGENVAQAYQFTYSEAAELGFVSLAQVPAGAGSRWIVPQALHSPIIQQAVLLDDAGRPFLEYLRTEDARAIIAGDGYTLP